MAHIDPGFWKYQSLCNAEPIRKGLQSAGELIYTTGRSFFTTTKGRRGCKSNRSAEKTPQRQGLCVLNTHKRWPNEFMAAELISCAIKVLRFFPCNTNGFTKLIEPLTASLSITMFCKRTDPGALKQHIPDTCIQGYIRCCLSGDEVRGSVPGWQQLSLNRRLWSNGLQFDECASCPWP